MYSFGMNSAYAGRFGVSELLLLMYIIWKMNDQESAQRWAWVSALILCQYCMHGVGGIFIIAHCNQRGHGRLGKETQGVLFWRLRVTTAKNQYERSNVEPI